MYLAGIFLALSFVAGSLLGAEQTSFNELLSRSPDSNQNLDHHISLVNQGSQLSCRGVEKQIQSQLQNLDDYELFVANLSKSGGLLQFRNFMDYLRNRSPLDMQKVANREVYLVEISLTLKKTTQKISINSRTDFWTFSYSGKTTPRIDASIDGKNILGITMNINSLDVCSTNGIEVIEFSGCQVDPDQGPTIDNRDHLGPWDTCTGIYKTKLSTSSLQKKLGLRPRVLQRGVKK